MTTEVSKNIHLITVNDRRKHLFENMWPLPNGVSYNCFLVADEKTALLDTVEFGSSIMFEAEIEALLNGKMLDYLIINHMEPDHSGEIQNILARYPDITVVGNDKTFKIFESYYGETKNKLVVKDGDTLCLGEKTLKFVLTPWVHWPETMMTYEINSATLFSGDAFGTFGTLDGCYFDDEMDAVAKYEDEMRRYYSNIVGKYSNMVQKAFAKLAGVEVKAICPLHGPVWRKNPAKVLELYDKWSKMEGDDGVVVAYASMYGATAYMADYVARKLAENGVENIVTHDVSKTHVSYLISDLWKYKAVVLGSCAYNTAMFPTMENFVNKMGHIGLKYRNLAIFGSYSWNGGGVRNLLTFAESSGWNMVGSVDMAGKPNAEKLAELDAIAKAIAESLNQ